MTNIWQANALLLSAGGAKDRHDWSYAPLGLIRFYDRKPSAHALGYILSRLRRCATPKFGRLSRPDASTRVLRRTGRSRAPATFKEGPFPGVVRQPQRLAGRRP